MNFSNKIADFDIEERVDKAVDNFINLCHADYLKENN